MTSRNTLRLVVCALALSSLGSLNSAYAQGRQAPFTIRRPSGESVVVREQVRVEIPRASIRQGGFVAFYIDGVFQEAVAPRDAASDFGKPFAWIWDTKVRKVADGPHTIRAVLFEPTSGGEGVAVTEKANSEVKVAVSNKIKNGPRSLYLRYKYREGQELTYGRNSKSVVVGGVSPTGTSDDVELSQVNSKHILDIEDARPEIALVRNRTTSIKLLMNGQEITLGRGQLSDSLYQELDTLGVVRYETGATTGLAEFTQQGLPVNNTLELPWLPPMRVSIGQTWATPAQRLDIPGLPPLLQPRVTLNNKLEGLEWEGGYPTAKIHQTYEGPLGRPIQFGPVDITSPTIKYERDVYLAYKSGTLVKTVRTLSISGRTYSSLGLQAPGAMAGMPGGMMGRGAMPGMMGGMPGMPPGMMGGMPGMPPGMMGGGMMGRGAGGLRGGRGLGGPPGMMGGGMMPGRGLGGGMMPGRGLGGVPGMQGRGGLPGGMGRGRGGGEDFGGLMPGGMQGALGGRGGLGGIRPPTGGAGGLGGQQTDQPVTVQATTTTQLQSGGG